MYILRPPLSRRYGEEGEKGPEHVVVVEIVFLPFPLLRPHFVISFIDKILAPDNKMLLELHTNVPVCQCVCVCFLSPAIPLKLLGFISTVEETALKELHSHHSKDEHEQHVDNEDVQNILQRVYYTVKHRLGEKDK